MFYVITTEYAGPNRLDSHGAIISRDPEATIQTTPGRTNMSGEERISGWLGQTGDWTSSAHGEFETLDEAIACCADLGCVVEQTPEYPEEGEVATYITEDANSSHVDAAEWYGQVSAADCGITAETTDEELAAKAEADDAEALTQSPERTVVHGTLDLFHQWRNELRTEAVEAV